MTDLLDPITVLYFGLVGGFAVGLFMLRARA